MMRTLRLSNHTKFGLSSKIGLSSKSLPLSSYKIEFSEQIRTLKTKQMAAETNVNKSVFIKARRNRPFRPCPHS
jgi:hypothetical protein